MSDNEDSEFSDFVGAVADVVSALIAGVVTNNPRFNNLEYIGVYALDGLGILASASNGDDPNYPLAQDIARAQAQLAGC